MHLGFFTFWKMKQLFKCSIFLESSKHPTLWKVYYLEDEATVQMFIFLESSKLPTLWKKCFSISNSKDLSVALTSKIRNISFPIYSSASFRYIAPHHSEQYKY